MKLQQTEQKLIRLNIGCGKDCKEGFINVDLEDTELNIDVRKGLAFDTNTVDFIHCSHFVEYLKYNEACEFLDEAFRVLKRGGKIRLSTADFENIKCLLKSAGFTRIQQVSFDPQLDSKQEVSLLVEAEKFTANENPNTSDYMDIVWTGRKFGVVSEQPGRIELYKHVASLCQGPKILDLGCGDGAFLSHVPNDFEKYGVDFSRVAIEKAQERQVGSFKIGDIRKLSYPSNSFDTVVLMEVIEHIDNVDAVISEAVKVTKNQGLLIITVPDKEKNRDEKWPGGVGLHLSEWSEDRLKELAQKFSLVITQLGRFNLNLILVSQKNVRKPKDAHHNGSDLLALVLQEDGNLFRFTKHVYLELSNLCNYADLHKACPVSKLQKTKTILPSSIVSDALETLGRFQFSGRIGFHAYNEPLIDPRLFTFIKDARGLCPESEIYICTNGYYLSQSLAVELVQAGVSSFNVSAYSDSEEDRLKKLSVPVDYVVRRMTLDRRMDLYESPVSNIDRPCYCPLYQIIVTAGGRISLCCLDWQRRHCFGNLHEQRFEEAMTDEQMWLTYERLSQGERFLDLCKRCRTSRGNPVTDIGGEDGTAALRSIAGPKANTGEMVSHKKAIVVPEPIYVKNEAGEETAIDVREDLADFTGLAAEEVERLLKRTGYNARDEFVDCIEREKSDHWFYLGSRYFLFENAIHGSELAEAVEKFLGPRAKIWEFGGGTGNLSLTLAAGGYDVCFTELNGLQKDFVRFRSDKYNLKIDIINSWDDKPKNAFDLVIAVDVLEHIPDYHLVLEQLCESVKPGGIIWETSAFKKDTGNPTHRTHDRHDYKKILADKGFIRIYGAQTGKIWQKAASCRDERQKGIDNTGALNINFESSELELNSDDAAFIRRSISRAFEELKAENYPLALDYFQDAYFLCADFADKQCARAVAYLGANKSKELESVAQGVLDKEPNHKAAKLLIPYVNGSLKLREGLDKLRAAKPAEALACFDKALAACRKFPNLHFGRATALVQLGKLCSAKEACQAELALQPEHDGVKRLLERIEEAINEYVEMQKAGAGPKTT